MDKTAVVTNLEDGGTEQEGRNSMQRASKKKKNRIICLVTFLAVYLITFLMLILGGVIDVGINIFESSNTPTPVNTTRLRETTLTNLAEIQVEVNFDLDVSPYPNPPRPYNVNIPDENCYVIFEDNTKTRYRLVTAATNPEPNNPLSFLTHVTPCGVCSNLQDLATYIETPDLTDPVRNCGLTADPLGCVSDIGFSEACARIWTYNLEFTRSQCLVVCLLNLATPNNLPSGGDNYCEPGFEESFQCRNAINNQPACDEFQYEEGEFRLNSCIQCDECRAGPMFQKVAGRTRRASGIKSQIKRPNVATEINHNYF